SKGMRGSVAEPRVRLHLGQPDGDLDVVHDGDENRTEQPGREPGSRPGEPLPGDGHGLPTAVLVHRNWLARRSRSRVSCSVTRFGAVPPKPVLDATEPSTVSPCRTSGVSCSEMSASSASERSGKSTPLSSQARTYRPAISCATRNGMPLRTSHSAT